MRLRHIGWSLLPVLLLLATVGCDDDGTLGAVDRDPTEPIVVRLVPTRISQHVGETVVAKIWIARAEDVGAVAFHLLYDKDVLQFIPPVTEGPFLGADGTDTVFLAVETSGGGDLVVGHSRLGGGAGADGWGLLATIEFFAFNQGSSGFEFTGASVRDPLAYGLPASFSAAQVHVRP